MPLVWPLQCAAEFRVRSIGDLTLLFGTFYWVLIDNCLNAAVDVAPVLRGVERERHEITDTFGSQSLIGG